MATAKKKTTVKAKKTTAKKTTAPKTVAKKKTVAKPAKKETKKKSSKKVVKKADKATTKKADGAKKTKSVKAKRIIPSKTAKATKTTKAKKSVKVKKSAKIDKSLTSLVEGKMAPKFILPSTTGVDIQLNTFRGIHNVVLYFYPKDNTPGCSLEAKEFQKQKGQFTKHNALIFGISPSSLEDHNAFKEKFKLTFPLLVDESSTVAKKYDVWKEKFIFGHKYKGVQRTTFIIDKKGKIAKIFTKIKVKGHAKRVLNQLKILTEIDEK